MLQESEIGNVFWSVACFILVKREASDLRATLVNIAAGFLMFGVLCDYSEDSFSMFPWDI